MLIHGNPDLVSSDPARLEYRLLAAPPSRQTRAGAGFDAEHAPAGPQVVPELQVSSVSVLQAKVMEGPASADRIVRTVHSAFPATSTVQLPLPATTRRPAH